ncbi:sugar transferase [Butyrivibrio fibrisolvens]|uniref:sugar transferase n=1 Tax=Butyrivibrio fibrisolvens TaxID=831 RepID=UPI00042A7BF1|nr:sugar transferase [Butyrivibrio fibrisolvens]
MKELVLGGSELIITSEWSSLAPAKNPARYPHLEVLEVPQQRCADIIYPRRYAGLVLEKKRAYSIVKRVLDMLLSSLALIALCPILLLVTIAISIEDGGKPFFTQERTGKDGRVFKMYKFRTMIKNAPQLHEQLLSRNEMDGPAFKMTNDPRVTRFGKILRKHGIDELPQLVNIIKGDMSIVGPRPLPVYEQDMCDEYQNQRLMVKPGLVCYWQCNPGKNTMPFDEWIELDLRYITERSLYTDLKVILSTISSGVLENNS